MIFIGKFGAGTKSRTRDPLITSQMLYQLSYTGGERCAYYLRPMRLSTAVFWVE